jgi:hypothetical protein
MIREWVTRLRQPDADRHSDNVERIGRNDGSRVGGAVARNDMVDRAVLLPRHSNRSYSNNYYSRNFGVDS